MVTIDTSGRDDFVEKEVDQESFRCFDFDSDERGSSSRLGGEREQIEDRAMT
jgi:hypothetical protein